MRRIALFLTALLVVASACNNKQATRDEDDADDLELQVVSYVSPDSTFSYQIEAPVEGGTALADSIIDHIWDCLGDDFRACYKGDNIEEAIVEAAKARYTSRQEQIAGFQEEFTDDEMPDYMLNWENTVGISKLCEADEFITFIFESYEYSGGAHGMSYHFGTTFLKDTGEQVDSTILKNVHDPEFQRLFKKELYDYFGSNGEGPLDDFLLYQSADDDIPMSNMYLTKKGVTFIYQPYEISFYAAGMPCVELTWKQIRPFLTKKAIKDLDLDDDDDMDDDDEDDD